MMSSLTLDTNEEVRRAASRAASVRFDESANHYAPSRQLIDLPTRTGSGLGTHPLSERSYSHRSEGRNSTIGFGRANSFGLENSRLLGSIHNSPRVSGHPPPGLFVLGPCPAIIRCWLTETFTNDALLYAAICTGSAVSSITMPLLQHIGLDSAIFEENGLRKVRLLVYLTEAKINVPSSRSASPSPSVPTVSTKFLVDEQSNQDKSIQIVLGSDVLRAQSADLLLSQDKLVIYDDDRNQLSVPLVRPEDDNVYRHLMTRARSRSGSMSSQIVPSDLISEASTPGIIGRPSRLSSVTGPLSPRMEAIAASTASDGQNKPDAPREILSRASTDLQSRFSDDSKPATSDSDKSTGNVAGKAANPGVWASSWRAASTTPLADSINGTRSASSVSRHTPARPMKVLKPVSRSMANVNRTVSNSSTTVTADSSASSSKGDETNGGQGGAMPTTKANPIGSGSAFGWLNSGQGRRTTTTSGGP